MMMNLFKKNHLVLGLGVLFVVSLFGAGVSDISAELPAVINIGTLNPGSKTHACDVKLAQVLTEYLGKPVKAIPFTKDRAKFETLMKGEIQMVSIAIAAADQAMKGIIEFSDPAWRPLPLHMIQHGIPLPLTMAARGDSKINKLSELKGKRIGHVPGWPASTVQAKAFLAFAGISEHEVTWVPFSDVTKCFEGVGAGQVDAVSGSLVNLTIIRLFSSPLSLKFFPVPKDDKEAWQRFWKHLPNHPHGIWEWGICEGKPLEVAMGRYFMAVLPQQPENDVYTLVKALFETYPKYKEFMVPDTRFFGLEETLNLDNWEVTDIPYHAGFIKYAREKGLWKAAHDAYQKKALAAEKERLAGKYR